MRPIKKASSLSILQLRLKYIHSIPVVICTNFENMELKYLRLIKTIAEEGNLANSSKKLFLTQSALSHQLRELETRLQCKVFARRRNLWELTEEGQVLYTTACEVVERIDVGLAEVRNLQSGASGTIRFSTECYSFYKGIPAFVQLMELVHPTVEVQLSLEATHHPIPKLLGKEIDMALVTDWSEQINLKSEVVYEDELYLLMHREHVLSNKEYVVPLDLLHTEILIHSYPLSSVALFKHFLEPAGVVPINITAIPLTEIALELVMANKGVMCLPKWCLENFTASAELLFKKMGVQGTKRTHYLVYRAEDDHKRYIKDFVTGYREFVGALGG